jgi:hypothetical protein
MNQRRLERRQKVAQLKVTHPEVSAQRKIRKHENKKVAAKRKLNQHLRFKRGDKRFKTGEDSE